MLEQLLIKKKPLQRRDRTYICVCNFCKFIIAYVCTSYQALVWEGGNIYVSYKRQMEWI